MPLEIKGRPGAAVPLYPQAGTGPGAALFGVDYLARVIRSSTTPGWNSVHVLDGSARGREGWVPDAALTDPKVGTVTSSDEMDELFRLLRAATFVAPSGVRTAIPFRYPKDGCYARAEVMAQILVAAGYTVDKEFAIAMKGLSVTTPHGGDIAGWGEPLQVDWWYHVAPVVYAAEGVPPTACVLDPSVSDTALSPAGWFSKMSTDPAPGEVKYAEFRAGLLAAKAYPLDRAQLVRAGRDVYAPPSATDPAASVLGSTQDPASALARAAALVAPHDVVAGLDAFFRRCHAAQLAGMRDNPIPYPQYAADRQGGLQGIQALQPGDRQYLAVSFPRFFADWGNTFLGTGIESDVRVLLKAVTL